MAIMKTMKIKYETMKEVRYFYVPNAANAGELPEEEAKHAVRVLRLQSGDRMILADGEGGLFDAEVSMASGKHCMYNILVADGSGVADDLLNCGYAKWLLHKNGEASQMLGRYASAMEAEQDDEHSKHIGKRKTYKLPYADVLSE
jgi:hypothetical protein